MLDAIYIKSILEQNQFDVEYLIGTKQAGIQVCKFNIGHEGKWDTYTISTNSILGKKVYIKSENGIAIFGDVLSLKIEKTIRLAISMTPENRLPFLIKPAYFISECFPELTEEIAVGIETIENDIRGILVPLDERVEETLSYHCIKLIKNTNLDLVKSIFSELKSFHSIVESDVSIKIHFYTFDNNPTSEYLRILKVQNELLKLGIVMEMDDVLSSVTA